MNNERQCHRNLLTAAKLLRDAFKARCRSSPHGMRHEDWRHVVRTNQAVSESKAVLEIGSKARIKVNEI